MEVVPEQEPVRTRHSFTDEFKRDAVALVIDEGRKVIDVARSLSVGEGTLGNWVRQARVDRGDRAGVSTEKRSEVVKLPRENAQLLEQRSQTVRVAQNRRPSPRTAAGYCTAVLGTELPTETA